MISLNQINVPALSYKDVYIVPQYSEVTSRTIVSTDTKIFDNLTIDVPVISANMDTITEAAMAIAIAKAGGLGALHRFCSINDNLDAFIDTDKAKVPVLVSVGVNGDSKERASALYKAGARFFLVDVAHGHHKQVGEIISYLKDKYKDIRIMAGNVATPEGVKFLAKAGADSVKVGIGPGNVCITKNVTGVTVPQFTAVRNCVDIEYYKIYTQDFWNTSIIADGGITEIGDIAKALAAGANAVMCGRLFAACKETPGPYLNGKKVYRGMASKDAMKKIRSETELPTPEGASVVIEDSPTSVEEVIKHIKGGLQSAFSYSGVTSLRAFQDNAVIGLRR